ncbi:hypothetical protein H0H92_012196 [Tricholoma furcatifolium]|nr:hypothetical protein H0H92_012196 [Tricholoma furcatifolium]
MYAMDVDDLMEILQPDIVQSTDDEMDEAMGIFDSPMDYEEEEISDGSTSELGLTQVTGAIQRFKPTHTATESSSVYPALPAEDPAVSQVRSSTLPASTPASVGAASAGASVDSAMTPASAGVAKSTSMTGSRKTAASASRPSRTKMTARKVNTEHLRAAKRERARYLATQRKLKAAAPKPVVGGGYDGRLEFMC